MAEDGLSVRKVSIDEYRARSRWHVSCEHGQFVVLATRNATAYEIADFALYGEGGGAFDGPILAWKRV